MSDTLNLPGGLSSEAHIGLLLASATQNASTDQLSPLLRASSWGFEDIVDKLINNGIDLGQSDTKGETALHKAARFAQLPVAARLLAAGASPDAVDGLGMTALHWAALNGNVRLTRLLLIHKADPTIRDYYAGGMTPMEMAQLMGHDSILDVVDRYHPLSEAS